MYAIFQLKPKIRICHGFDIKVKERPYQKGEGPIGLSEMRVIENKIGTAQNLNEHIV